MTFTGGLIFPLRFHGCLTKEGLIQIINYLFLFQVAIISPSIKSNCYMQANLQSKTINSELNPELLWPKRPLHLALLALIVCNNSKIRQHSFYGICFSREKGG